MKYIIVYIIDIYYIDICKSIINIFYTGHMCTLLNGFAWLARWSLENDITAFAMVYKVHAWKYEALDLFKALNKREPSNS